ncbi:MAG TPA: PA14 domain-containing protein, partial [Chthoniobacteraceae bacterium]|nr:PA14 domain-containing protein [Chthoniobacteraceae bacterium]
VAAGRVEIRGRLTLPNSPTIANGATLALYKTLTNSLPAVITLPTGNLEVVPTSLGADTNRLDLTGGTLTLSTLDNGLNGSFFSGDDAGANANFALGPDFYLNYTTYLNGRTPTVTALTSAAGVTVLDYPNGDYATFGAYGFPDINNFVSRMSGKIAIPVDGVYNFGTTSDDGSVVYIDGQLVVNNNVYQGPTRREGNIGLTAGVHDIDIGFYEGGVTQQLTVDWTVPGGTRTVLPNTVLFPDLSPVSFANPIDVLQNSTINVSAAAAMVNALTVRSGATLTTGGAQLTAPTLTLPVPGAGTGTYTFAPSNTFVVGNVAEGGPAIAVNIVKTGPGVLTFDNTATPQLQNAANTIRVDQGLVGIVMQTGGSNAIGNAVLTMNGGGVLVSSKGGNQSFSLPYLQTGNGAIVAGQTGSGIDGTPAAPIVITVANPLNIPADKTFTLGSQNNYVLNIGGTTTGTGTMRISGGTVNAATRASVNGLKLSMNPLNGTATLNVQESGPLSFQSLSSSGAGASKLVIGDGTNPVDLTINGSDEGFFSGLISQAANTVIRLIRDGTGKQTLANPANNYTGGTRIVNGILSVLSPGSLGTGPVELAGGTLQTPLGGLLGEYYDASKGGAAGANAAFGGGIDAFNAYFDAKGTPTVSAVTSTNGRTDLRFTTSTALNAGGSNTAIFADQGFNALDNMAVRYRGTFYAFTAGDYVFTTRSDDGSMLFIDGAVVVTSNVDQGMTTVSGAPITLTAGAHSIAVGFNENGGDQGLEVRYTPPGGVDQFIPNSVLPQFISTAPLNLTSNSTIDLQNSTALPGVLRHDPGITLTTVGGTAIFPQVTLAAPSPTGPASYGYAPSGTIIVQDFVDGGRQVTIDKTGTGNLILNAVTPQFTNANDVINVTQGTVTAVLGGTANANPLGQASLNLNGGGLRVSSAGGDITFSKPFQITQSSSIEAGNFGAGAVDGARATFSNTLTVGSGQTLTTRSSNGYTLALKGVTGAGSLAVDGGVVALEGPTNPNALVVNSGLATVTSGTLSPAGGATVNGSGTLGFDPGAGGTANYGGGPISMNGGTLRAQSGITNLAAMPITFSQRTSTVVPNALLARLVDIGLAGSVFPGNTDAGIAGAIAAPGIEKPISSAISFLPYQAADGTFSTFFGGGNTDRFAAVFVGEFKAPLTGDYQAQIAQEDDNAGFWIDLNQNGVFEATGTAGAELLSGRTCCGDGPIGTASLVANQTYRVAMAVEDTGGGSSIVGLAALPGGGLTTVNPGDAAQTGLWSFSQFSGGGN